MSPATRLSVGHGRQPALSVVIVSWNTAGYIDRCVRSVLEFTTSVELEVVVVDNASSDGTPALLRSAFPEVRLIENQENLGFACACNQGMAESRGEFVLLLNSDTFVTDDVVGKAVCHLMSRPEFGMLGCELRFPDGRRQFTANRSLSVRRSLGERLWLYRLLPRGRRAEFLLGGYWEDDREIAVDWLAGVFLLLRRELFERSGGFDPRFFMYGEDSEWCMRLGRLGYRILYAPRVGTVYHIGAASSDLVWTEPERLERCYQGGIDAYAALHGQRRAAIYRLAELLGVTVRFCAYRAASMLRPQEYLVEQAAFYRWLAAFYCSYGDDRRRRDSITADGSSGTQDSASGVSMS